MLYNGTVRVSGQDGVDVLTNIQQLSFADGSVSVFNNAPVVVVADPINVAHRANPLASSLFSVSDVDGDTIARYQFWDSTADAASGSWMVNGVAQATGVAIDVTAAQLGQTRFQSGSGTDDLWVRASDGISWSAWKAFHVVAPVNNAPVVVVADPINVAHRANPLASSLFSVSDVDGDTIARYQFWDSTADAASGSWMVNGVAQATGVAIDVTAAQLGQTRFQSGSGTDDLWVRASDGISWSAWKAFHVVAPVNNAPVVVVADPINVAHRANPLASSLFSVSDVDGDTIARYQFWDSTADAASGSWMVNGVAQATGVAIDVTAAQLGQTRFQSGSGTDDLWVRASDGISWSAWKAFHVAAPVNNAPVVVVADPINVAHRANPLASSLFSVSDVDGDTIARYQFWDSTADAASGSWMVNGVAQATGVAIDVTAAQLGQTRFQSGSGTDDLWVRASDGISWSAWKAFHVAAPVNNAPVVVADPTNVAHGANPLASSLFSVSDVDGDTIARYQFWDSTADAASGSWMVNGVAQATGVAIDVTAAQLGQTTFQSGSGTDDLWVRASDGISWSAWKAFHVAAPVNNAPVVVAADPIHVAHGANALASSLFSVSDVDGDTVARYQFWDSTADAASGHWMVNGVAQATGVAIDVAASQLGQTTFQSGSGTDDLWVRASDGIEWSAWKAFHVAAPVNNAPVVVVADSIHFPQGANALASLLFSVSDADGDTITRYQFWDSTADAASGSWMVNGVAQATGVAIDVTAAQLGQTRFQAGSGNDDLWVRASDGIEWGAWKEFHVVEPVDPWL